MPRATLAVLLAGVPACGSSSSEVVPARDGPIAVEPFASAFSPVGRIELQQPGSTPAARISGLSVLRDGGPVASGDTLVALVPDGEGRSAEVAVELFVARE